MGSDIDPGQAYDGSHVQGDGAAGLAEAGEGGGAQGDGDAGVPGQVAEPGGFAAADAGLREQGRRPGRRTICLKTLDSAQVPAPPARSRPASSRSPASHAAPAAAGAAPRVPSCMTAQAGG